MRRLPVILALLAIAGLAYRLFGQSAQPRLLWPVNGRLLSPLVADDRWIGWVEQDEIASRLVVAPRKGGPRRTVLSGEGLSGLTIEGDRAFVARAEAGPGRAGGALEQVTLPDGGATTIASLVGMPDEIIASGDWLVWRSTRRSALPGVPFVVAAAPLIVIQARRTEGGPVHTLTVVRGDRSASTAGCDLLGVVDGQAYWIERDSPGAGLQTRVLRAPCQGGDLDRVIEERGSRAAALQDDVLIWTAPSLDAGAIDSYASVKRLHIGHPQPEVIADWLEPGAGVLLSHGTAYAHDRNGLWRLGRRRGDQRRLFARPPRVIALSAVGDHEYLVMAGAEGSVVAQRPLTWWARIKAAVAL